MRKPLFTHGLELRVWLYLAHPIIIRCIKYLSCHHISATSRTFDTACARRWRKRPDRILPTVRRCPAPPRGAATICGPPVIADELVQPGIQRPCQVVHDQREDLMLLPTPTVQLSKAGTGHKFGPINYSS